jgi:divalent metal cation (Fe/Co/Zn/Cd) transporter
VLGLITNAWFWRRYTRQNQEHYSSLIESQGRLYRAKAMVDLAVIAALASVAINPAHPLTRYIDVLGSLVVAAYLLWNGWSAARSVRAPLSPN